MLTLTPLPFTAVAFDDEFWAPRLETNRALTIPHIYHQLEQTGRLAAFDLAFERPLPAPVVLIFGDSDVFKWLEAACYALAWQPEPALAALVDQVTDKIIQAQQPDGYLNTHFIRADPAMRWRNLRDWHELYCAGNLMEAGVAYYQATGHRRLLEAACRYADLIAATFGRAPGQKRGYPGHPEIELALVRLYHASGERRYLDLASYFVDERGAQPHYYDQEARLRGEDPADFWAKTYEYCQAHLPLRQQTKLVGHAVRAMYLLAAAADLARENSDPTLLETCQRLWDNLAQARMYLTGGLGPSRHNEGFTQDYDLPEEAAYAETCAAIGLIFWDQRLLQLTGLRQYADSLERTLYNGFLSGISLSGERFFYVNPLASSGNHHRQPWFYCQCCPPNVARLLASLGGYFYATGPGAAWVHLYAQSTARLEVDGKPLTLRQVTRYPWQGNIELQLQLAAPQAFTLHLRLPGWCENWQAELNGAALPGSILQPNGYLAIQREWRDGDRLRLELELPIRPVWANPAVPQLQGRLALQRGPLVYCLEAVDHPDGPLDRISVDAAQARAGFQAAWQADLLGGVVTLHGEGRLASTEGWGNALYRPHPPAQQPVSLTAIPYYAWDNRAPGEMRVWLRASRP
jgi:DUF1680 family protein